MLSNKRLQIFQKKLSHDPIVKEIQHYLLVSETYYTLRQVEFGARLALHQACRAFLSGNYGIGAVILVRKPHETQLFWGKNKIVTGKYSERFNTHAETDAIKNWLSSIDKKTKPDACFKQENQKVGVQLFTNLEPCPKCEMEITMLLVLAKEIISPRAHVQCIFASTEGKLEMENGVFCSNGSAHAVGKKHLTSPLVWRSIQRGFFSDQKALKHPPVLFSLLHTSSDSLQGMVEPGAYIHTDDKDLVRLSSEIFTKTRKKIDRFLISDRI